MITFKELKEKYKNIDFAKDYEEKIIIGDYFISEDGSITLSRNGNGFRGDYISIFTEIAGNATMEQIDSFIQMITK